MNIFVFLLILLVPSASAAGVLTADTVWEGEVLVQDDVMVPEQVTLIVRPGAVVKVASAESTKTDPEYLSTLTEITIRGTLKVEGTEKSPVLFQLSGETRAGGWAGIIIDGGTAYITSCTIRDAETGIHVINGTVKAKAVLITGNRYGLAAQGEKTAVSLISSVVEENDYGILALNGAAVETKKSAVRRNRKKDQYSYKAKERIDQNDSGKEHQDREAARQYGDEVLLGDTVWQGRVRIEGIVRVPEKSRLVILPGTIIEFKRKDTNADGIGENGFMIQGVIIAKGTAEKPIVFRSAEQRRRPGDWDAINIMNSDGAQNLIEHCRIEDAYRGLHFHFSNVAVKESVFMNNYRGIQFQESAAEIAGNRFMGNKSGVQARDSEIVFARNDVSGNYSGAHFYRSVLTASGNSFRNNFREGLRVREGIPVVERNLIDGNRFGMLILDTVYGNFSRNAVAHNAESGISVRGADTIEISGNFIHGNGLTGVSIQDARAALAGNMISENGVRGIGILSFSGTISGNAIVKNGQYALEMEGTSDVSAAMNWWGGEDGGKAIYDREDDPAKGRVTYSPVSTLPPVIAWPLDAVGTDVTWRGAVNVQAEVLVPPGATLTVAPGTKVLFSRGAGLRIQGAASVKGTQGERVTFTSLEGSGSGDWNEVFLDHAGPGVFSYSDFEHATWAVHSHFTNLTVTGCGFRRNYGGIRFRSGPVEIARSVFEGNSIGIRAYRGNALIADNTITGNETGIFVREKGGGLTVKRNNIFGNSEYGIRLGDFNDEDVLAPENYWGPGGPGDTIFDSRKEPGIGRVLYEPFSRKPHAVEGAGK